VSLQRQRRRRRRRRRWDPWSAIRQCKDLCNFAVYCMYLTLLRLRNLLTEMGKPLIFTWLTFKINLVNRATHVCPVRPAWYIPIYSQNGSPTPRPMPLLNLFHIFLQNSRRVERFYIWTLLAFGGGVGCPIRKEIGKNSSPPGVNSQLVRFAHGLHQSVGVDK
jgi:hypothetical protein